MHIIFRTLSWQGNLILVHVSRRHIAILTIRHRVGRTRGNLPAVSKVQILNRENLLEAFYLLILVGLCGCGTSVHDDVARGDMDALTRKIERGPELLESRNALGKTPLHYAVTFAQKEAMVFLIEQGADVSAPDGTGLTPLHVAAIVDVRGPARLLLDAGATLEAKDNFGDTPLHSAAMHGSMRVLEFLLDRGADASARNQEGLTPLDLARRHDRTEALKRLLREDVPANG